MSSRPEVSVRSHTSTSRMCIVADLPHKIGGRVHWHSWIPGIKHYPPSKTITPCGGETNRQLSSSPHTRTFQVLEPMWSMDSYGNASHGLTGSVLHWCLCLGPQSGARFPGIVPLLPPELELV